MEVKNAYNRDLFAGVFFIINQNERDQKTWNS